jgi:hypothetical protein
MENDPFGRKSPETPDDDADDDSSSKKKKKNKRLPLFNAPIESTEESAESEKSTESKKDESAAEELWRRVTGQPESDKESPADTETENHAGAALEGAEHEHEVPLENLSEAEQLEVAEAYIAARHAELLEEQSTAVEGEDEAAVQERAADIALLEAMRRLLGPDHEGEQPASEPLEAAYDSTVHSLGYSESTASSTPESQTLPETETEPEALPLRPAATITLRPEHRQMSGGRTEAVTGVVPETTPAFKTRETSEEQQSAADLRRRTGSALLVGGFVGYFVGRRRGRINTEKKFKVVETKLTKQIEQVQQTVVQKEQQIRRLARASYEAKAVPTPAPKAERAVPKIEQQPSLRTEKLGLVTLKAVEAPRSPEAPAAAPNKQTKAESLAPVQKPKVESLSRPELLAVAAEIKVGATDLRRVFETNLVSEVGLRRLVVAHERGDNIRVTLEREITEKEMSYERDPRLRNSAVMGSLAARKVVRADIDKPAPTLPKPQRSDDDSKSDSSAKQKQVQNTSTPPAAVAAVVTLVAVIAVLLVILFTSR